MRDSCRSDLKGLAEELGFGIDFSAVVCSVSSTPNSQASLDILVVPVRRLGDTSRNWGMMRNLLRDWRCAMRYVSYLRTVRAG